PERPGDDHVLAVLGLNDKGLDLYRAHVVVQVVRIDVVDGIDPIFDVDAEVAAANGIDVDGLRPGGSVRHDKGVEVGAGGAAVDRIGVVVAVDRVSAAADGVVDGVVAGVAVDRVVAEAAVDRVALAAAGDRVCRARAVHGDRVGARGPS